MKMNNEKLDTTLNLSLDADDIQRMKSEILSNGFDETSRTWEVIVKYHGDISTIGVDEKDIDVLLNGYAIMRLTREQLQQSDWPEQIEYIEMPKDMLFHVYREKQESCVLPVTAGPFPLSGNGILVACIDSGIDYLLRDFQNEKGSRILYLWDQTLEQEETLKNELGIGREFTKEDIDRAIVSANLGNGNYDYQRAREIVPSLDSSGHGTAVAGIAAGSAVSPLYQGVAPESEFIIVKLRGRRQNGSLTTDLIRGITYVVRKAEELRRPVVINLSIGDTYGAHDGTSLVERFIDSVCENGRNVICIGAGNEAVSNGHTSFILQEEERVEFAIAEGERGVNVQLWKNYVDVCNLSLEAPNGERFEVILTRRGMQTWMVGNTQVLIYVGAPKPFTVNEEIFFDFIPNDSYIDSGIWIFTVTPISKNQHDYHMFLPSSTIRNFGTRFLRPTPELTMTIPAFAQRALTVGAYDIVTNSYADFSGRDREYGKEGKLFFATDVKPDIAAPGVGIIAPVAGGGYASFTGTSFATPLVTGSVALLMEWGIIRGNDLFLYGEKVKAYLRKGARDLSGDLSYPNNKTGWGGLCVRDSLPDTI